MMSVPLNHKFSGAGIYHLLTGNATLTTPEELQASRTIKCMGNY